MARPKTSNDRCIKGFKSILEANPSGLFTTEDVAVWADVTRKYAYQVIAYGMSNGYIDVVKKDYETSTSFYELTGARKVWLTRRWGNGSLGSDDEESSGDVVQARDGEHRQEAHIRDTTTDAINSSKQLIALMSAPASERAKFRRLWNSSSS